MRASRGARTLGSLRRVDDLGRDAVAARLRRAGCVFAEEEADLLIAEAPDLAHRERLVSRREAGEPLEPLLGWVDFGGLRIVIEPGVFVPRQRSRLLVRLAADRVRAHLSSSPSFVPGSGSGPVVLDLCCGSGAVGAAVAAAVPSAEVFAADVDPVAVHCATRNLPADRVFRGDLFAALPTPLRGRLDVVVANAPYVPTDAIDLMPPEARLHEPAAALDGGPDGTDVHRRIAAAAPDWLAPGGWLLVETGAAQARTTSAAFTAAGLTARTVHSDELDATVVLGRLG